MERTAEPLRLRRARDPPRTLIFARIVICYGCSKLSAKRGNDVT